MAEPFTSFSSRTVVLREENIDTDQIIPARFLTTTARGGLGKLAFHDWRYDGNGRDNPGFVLNRLQYLSGRYQISRLPSSDDSPHPDSL